MDLCRPRAGENHGYRSAPVGFGHYHVSALDIFWDETREGGLFKTTDRGLTWDTLGFRHSHVLSVAIDRLNPETVWIANDVAGIWRSTDGGLTWENRSTGIFWGGTDNYGSVSIAVCSHDSRYLLCGNGSDVGLGRAYFTSNGGESWQPAIGVTNNYAELIAYDPAVPGLVYGAVANGDQVFASVDTGRTFSARTPLYGIISFDLQTAPNWPGAVWYTTFERGVQFSADSGVTWDTILTQFMMDSVVGSLDIVGAADTLVFESNTGVFFTDDGGNSVTELGELNIPPGVGPGKIMIVATDPFELIISRTQQGLWSYTIDSSEAIDRDVGDSRQDTPFALFPNPARTGMPILIDLDMYEFARVRVYDLLGRSVLDRVALPSSGVIHLELPEHLSSGTYFISVLPAFRHQENAHILQFNLI